MLCKFLCEIQYRRCAPDGFLIDQQTAFDPRGHQFASFLRCCQDKLKIQITREGQRRGDSRLIHLSEGFIEKHKATCRAAIQRAASIQAIHRSENGDVVGRLCLAAGLVTGDLVVERVPPIGVQDFEVVVEVLPVVGFRFEFSLDLPCLGFDKSIQKVSSVSFSSGAARAEAPKRDSFSKRPASMTRLWKSRCAGSISTVN